MSESRFTPSPWTLAGTANQEFVCDSRANIIAALPIGNARFHPEVKANARLISAAPEVLEVLKEAFRVSTEHANLCPKSAWGATVTSKCTCWRARAQAIIAKAEGK